MGSAPTPPDFFRRVYDVVRRIPAGRVATYGQIAHLLGQPMAARAVGYALAHLPEGTDVPWQRVINREGRISPRGIGAAPGDRQRALLEADGVRFDAEGRVPLRTFQWEGPVQGRDTSLSR
ncbi:MAG TPA: MGMT family protein [Stenomitos sp.]